MTTLKGVFPDTRPIRQKNFIRENVQNLKKMEQYFQLNKETEEIHRKHLRTSEKYQNITSRVNSSLGKGCMDRKLYSSSSSNYKDDQKTVLRKTSAPILPNKTHIDRKKAQNNDIRNSRLLRKENKKLDTHKKTEERLCKAVSELNLGYDKNIDENLPEHRTVIYKSQSMQTCDENDINNLYATGVIKYPSTKSKKCGSDEGINENKNENQTIEQETYEEHKKTLLDGGDTNHHNLQHRSQSSQSRKHHQSVANKLAEQLNNGIVPPNYRMGVVPKYIKERKEALQKEQKAKAEANSSDCPEGHILLPDEERKETLRMLKKSYQEYITELNKLPIRNDTLRAQKRKIEIEKQLNKLEEGLKVFSRPKVYVKLDS